MIAASFDRRVRHRPILSAPPSPRSERAAAAPPRPKLATVPAYIPLQSKRAAAAPPRSKLAAVPATAPYRRSGTPYARPPRSVCAATAPPRARGSLFCLPQAPATPQPSPVRSLDPCAPQPSLKPAASPPRARRRSPAPSPLQPRPERAVVAEMVLRAMTMLIHFDLEPCWQIDLLHPVFKIL